MAVSNKKYNVIDLKTGKLDSRIFSDPDIYREELEKIFGRTWLMIGHESLVPKVNDFFHTYMGEDRVILTRDGKGKLHAFLNMCRHRGNAIVRTDVDARPNGRATGTTPTHRKAFTDVRVRTSGSASRWDHRTNGRLLSKSWATRNGPRAISSATPSAVGSIMTNWTGLSPSGRPNTHRPRSRRNCSLAESPRFRRFLPAS